MDEWLTTAEAAAELGVKAQTLYAYVSRGQLARRSAEGGSGSLFHRDDVARLAARGSRRRREGRVDVHVDSAITLLDPDGRLFYRGEDAAALAGTRSFEEVTEWLWTGAWAPAPHWAVRPSHEGVDMFVAAALPAMASRRACWAASSGSMSAACRAGSRAGSCSSASARAANSAWRSSRPVT